MAISWLRYTDFARGAETICSYSTLYAIINCGVDKEVVYLLYEIFSWSTLSRTNELENETDVKGCINDLIDADIETRAFEPDRGIAKQLGLGAERLWPSPPVTVW